MTEKLTQYLYSSLLHHHKVLSTMFASNKCCFKGRQIQDSTYVTYAQGESCDIGKRQSISLPKVTMEFFLTFI